MLATRCCSALAKKHRPAVMRAGATSWCSKRERLQQMSVRDAKLSQTSRKGIRGRLVAQRRGAKRSQNYRCDRRTEIGADPAHERRAADEWRLEFLGFSVARVDSCARHVLRETLRGGPRQANASCDGKRAIRRLGRQAGRQAANGGGRGQLGRVRGRECRWAHSSAICRCRWLTRAKSSARKRKRERNVDTLLVS